MPKLAHETAMPYQSDEKTWHDQKIDKDKDKDNDNDKDILRTPPKSNPRDL